MQLKIIQTIKDCIGKSLVILNQIHSLKRKFVQLWSWYVDNENGYINDEAKAKILIVDYYEKLGIYYDLIRFDRDFNLLSNEELLGIDISSIGGDSLLSFGLNYQRYDKRIIKIIPRLTDKLQAMFQSKLNHNLLFSNIEDANQFLSILKKNEKLFWELTDGGCSKWDYCPFYVYKVLI